MLVMWKTSSRVEISTRRIEGWEAKSVQTSSFHEGWDFGMYIVTSGLRSPYGGRMHCQSGWEGQPKISRPDMTLMPIRPNQGSWMRITSATKRPEEDTLRRE